MLETVGSGLALISFDIRYGSRIFIDEGKNGYRVPIGDVQKMAEGIVRFCDHYNLDLRRPYTIGISWQIYTYIRYRTLTEWFPMSMSSWKTGI